MKKEYKIKDPVWIHVGGPKLTKGRVVEVMDLVHLNEGYKEENELYVIEIDTSIDPIYEVRTFEQISPDAKGPIQLYRSMDIAKEQLLMKKVGVVMPINPSDFDDIDDMEPTPEQIHAAMDRAEKANQDTFTVSTIAPKKRNFAPKGKTGPRKPRRPPM